MCLMTHCRVPFFVALLATLMLSACGRHTCDRVASADLLQESWRTLGRLRDGLATPVRVRVIGAYGGTGLLGGAAMFRPVAAAGEEGDLARWAMQVEFTDAELESLSAYDTGCPILLEVEFESKSDTLRGLMFVKGRVLDWVGAGHP